MRSVRPILAAGIFAALAVVALPAWQGAPIAPRPGQDAAAPPPATGFILGRVIDAGTNAAVPDALLYLSSPALGSAGTVFPGGVSGGPRRVATGAGGVFLFRDLPKGSYQIGVTATGYMPGDYGQAQPRAAIARVLDVVRQLDLAEGEHLSDVVIRMWKPGAITGTVVDEAGEPMVGVSVSSVARLNTWDGPLLQPSYVVTTDDRGMYRLEATPGEYLVAVIATPTTLPADTIDEYQLAQASGAAGERAYIQGLLAAGLPSSPPTSGVRVGNLLIGAPNGKPFLVPPTVAGDGHLTMYPTTYYPAARTFTSAAAISVASGDEKNGVDIQLRPVSTYRVGGTLVGPNGPVPGVGIRLYQSDVVSLPSTPASMESLQTRSDSKGEFAFLGVVPGQYTLRVLKTPVASTGLATLVNGVMIDDGGTISSEPILWSAQPVSVTETDVTGLRVSLQAGARFSGRVEFSGSATQPTPQQLKSLTITPRPLPGTLAALVAAPSIGRVDGNMNFTTPQQSPGKYVFAIAGVPANWAVKSAIVAGQDATDVPVDLGGSDINNVVITLTDRVSKITGFARDADGQAPKVAAVVVFPTDPALWPRVALRSRRQQVITPGRDGRYLISGLPAGDYIVAAVSTSAGADFTDPKNLRSLMRTGTPISIAEGETRTLDLRIGEIK